MPELHECKYCGVMTDAPDEQCYKAPNSMAYDLHIMRGRETTTVTAGTIKATPTDMEYLEREIGLLKKRMSRYETMVWTILIGAIAVICIVGR